MLSLSAGIAIHKFPYSDNLTLSGYPKIFYNITFPLSLEPRTNFESLLLLVSTKYRQLSFSLYYMPFTKCKPSAKSYNYLFFNSTLKIRPEPSL